MDTAKERIQQIAASAGRLSRGVWRRGISLAKRCAAFPKDVERRMRRRRLPCKPVHFAVPRRSSPVIEGLGAIRLEGSAVDCEGDVLGACAFRARLALGPPRVARAVSARCQRGAGGDYCRWICTAGADEFGLSPRDGKPERGFFPPLGRGRAAPLRLFAEPAGQVSLGTDALRATLVCRWLFAAGKRKFQLRDEEIWWFLVECGEDPTGGAAVTYLRSPAWQERFPLGITPFQWSELLAWIRRKYRVDLGEITPPEVLAPADEVRLLQGHLDQIRPGGAEGLAAADGPQRVVRWWREQTAFRGQRSGAWWARLQEDVEQGRLQRPGINVLGFFGFPSGLREAGRSGVARAPGAGIETSTRNVPVNRPHAIVNHSEHLGLEIFPQSLLIFNPEISVPCFYKLGGLHMRPDVYRIVYWYWELEVVPPLWVDMCRPSSKYGRPRGSLPRRCVAPCRFPSSTCCRGWS